MTIPFPSIDRRQFVQGLAALASIHPAAIVAASSTFAGGSLGFHADPATTPSSTPSLLPLPSAEPFFEWLTDRTQSLESSSPAWEPLRSLIASLRIPRDGRSRFLMPRARTVGRRLTTAWEAAFPSSVDRETLQRYLISLDGDIQMEIERAQTANQLDQASRWNWLRAGFATLRIPQAEVRWPPAEAILTPRRVRASSKGSHPITGWPASAYQLIQTPHFDIAFQGRSQNGAEVAEYCELAFALWRQMFFEYARSNEQTGAPNLSSRERPFQVVIFRSRDAYLSALASSVRNVALSNGYYNPSQSVSLFYLEGPRNFSTLVHELTHQFFSEASGQPVVFDSDQTPGFWAVEGVALFMESLSALDLGTAFLIDIGGWDSNRLQAGRYRLLHDQIWFPWQEFGNANGLAFRDARDLPKRYSQACGLAHFWMEQGESSIGFREHLARLYHRGDAQSWSPGSDEELTKNYATYLQKSPFLEEDYLPHTDRNELVLSRSPVTADWLLKCLGGRTQWNSIDLSFTQIDDAAWLAPDTTWDLVRLNVESTAISNGALSGIAKMPRLQELDLSHCKIDSDGMESLRNHPQLQTLWIAGTAVDDRALSALREIPKLAALHAAGSRISASAWNQLMQAIPRLKKNSTAP
ncbi:Leucine Rich repeats (2 copies) [Pirellula sp. SH-Sr6A]|uniref:hypothetical protein n=1 Tax=Pirellula sp. SH-Sr6A TaxID=1632865 RepID=UPI00078DACAB|nr:hypothetical protein [Pirellula sp. SH-Sr6A]AMV33130.1 Leucine Rich repeats (2 copies) [Pirellula sp. SH-Sr6A]